MFKLVVLSALVAVAVAKPSFGYSAWASPSVVAYSSPIVGVVPGAVSHSYRSDVISKPVVTAYAAPAVIASPVVHKVVAPVAVPAAVSHSYRSDVISKPVVTAYAAEAVVATPVVQKVVASIAAPAAVSHSYRSDVISKPLVATYSAPAVVSNHLAYAAHVPALQAW